MKMDTSVRVPMVEANQDFSKVAQLVDERGAVVIMMNNQPRYVVSDFEEYNELQSIDNQHFQNLVDDFIKEKQEALQELAKY